MWMPGKRRSKNQNVRMKLREYQAEALEKIMSGFGDRQKLLAVMPTGSGKTILFAHLARAFQPRRTLVLAHREELIDQAVDKIWRSTGIAAEVEMAEDRASLEAPVVVASVQTMIRRAGRWPADHFGLVVVDEAHHTLADSYLNTLERFDSAKILGVTATPDRGDKKRLGKFYEDVAAEVGLVRLITEGWLSRIKVRRIPVEIDLRGLRRLAGDFAAEDLAHAIAPGLHDVAMAMSSECWDRKTIVFLPLVKIAREFAALLREGGLEAHAVAGEDPSDYRSRTLDWFSKAPAGSVLCNAMLLTEGYDQPDVDAIVCLRPTQIRSLWAQMVGRGTRIHPGKEDLLLLDLLWQTDQHNLVTPASLFAGNEEDARAIDLALIANGADGSTEDVDLLETARDVEAERMEKLRERLEKNRKKAPGTYDMMEFLVALDALELAEYEPVTEWQEKEVTGPQLALLAKWGFDHQGITCRGHASAIIGTIIERNKAGLATPKQVRKLKQWRHPNPTGATRGEAGQFIGETIARRRGITSTTPL
jgi:superfamily II DNA or RNA helicase